MAAGGAARRKPLEIRELTAAEPEALVALYRRTREVRLRTRAQIVRLAGEQRRTAPAITRVAWEDAQTVRRRLQRLVDSLAERTGIRVSDETVRRALKHAGIVLSRPQHKISRPDPDYAVKKRRLKTPATS